MMTKFGALLCTVGVVFASASQAEFYHQGNVSIEIVGGLARLANQDVVSLTQDLVEQNEHETDLQWGGRLTGSLSRRWAWSFGVEQFAGYSCKEIDDYDDADACNPNSKVSSQLTYAGLIYRRNIIHDGLWFIELDVAKTKGIVTFSKANADGTKQETEKDYAPSASIGFSFATSTSTAVHFYLRRTYADWADWRNISIGWSYTF